MPSETPSPAPVKRPWVLTFFSLLVLAGLVALPLVVGKPGKSEFPDLVRFIGHFHPFLLHLPIGVFALILFQEIGAIFGRRGRVAGNGSLFPMFFGAASGVVAALAGFLLYHGHGADYAENELAGRHLWGGLAFAGLAVLTFMLKAWTVRCSTNPAWYRLVFFASIGVMAFASHDGASITHGSDYLTQYAPEPLRKMLGLEAAAVKSTGTKKPAGDPVVYADIVAPILERRCLQCHKQEKSKGKFRMDTHELLVKGGKEGPGIEPGNSAKSNIIVRIGLPEDDDEHMPPKGKPAIEEAEVLVLKWWIDNGADAHKTLSSMNAPEPVKAALAKLSNASSRPTEEPAGHGSPAVPAVPAGPSEQLKSQVGELSKQFPGAISFESQQSPLVTFSAVSLRGKLDDEMFGKLAPLMPHVVTLDLSATRITDKSAGMLKSATNLKMVRLAETGITDSAIETLVKLPALESVNVYGTKVTDTGVLKLAAMPKLKRLYLWQTAVTPDAIKALREKLPGCEIVTGAETKAVN